MIDNCHLNIFHSYQQHDTRPIENNLSRGLAIIFQEYPEILMLFLEKVREKIQQTKSGFEVHIPREEYIIGFQRRVSEIREAEKVIGIALTAKELEMSGSEKVFDEHPDYEPITDLTLMYDDTAVIIEVKRNETDCRKQLEEQVKKYITDRDSEVEFISLTWTDIVLILQRYQRLHKGNIDRLVKDYYEEMEVCYPEWFPTLPLIKLKVEEKERINKRLTNIKEHYIKLRNDNRNTVYGRGAIPISFGWASECNLHFVENFFTKDHRNKPCIGIRICAADTCAQYYKLISCSPRLIFANQKNQRLLLKNNTIVDVRIVPYVKVSDSFRGLFWVYLNDLRIDDSQKFIQFGNGITKRWRKEDWGEFQKIMRMSDVVSEEKWKDFLLKFQDKLLNTRRTVMKVSLGFEIYAYLPFKEAQKIDSDDENYAFVDFLGETIDGLKRLIQQK